MQLGSWAITNSIPLLSLLPLLVFLILSFKGVRCLTAMVVGIGIGIIVNGISLSSLAAGYSAALSSSTFLIGMIIMLGSGLAQVMNEARITHTLVYGIVRGIGVNTQNRARLALAISSIVICGLLGTLFGGAAVIAPIVIPVMASVGLTPSSVTVLYKIAGEVGLMIGPLTGVTLILLEVTGLSYGEMLLWAGGPFSIIFLASAWLGSIWVQKRTEGKEHYDLADMQDLDAFVLTKKDIINTVAFLVAFGLLVAYGVIRAQGTNYSLLVMLVLMVVVSIVGRIKVDVAIEKVVHGMQSQIEMFLTFLNIEVMLAMVTLGGGMDALADLFSGLAQNDPSILMLLTSLVGGVGIEAASVAEIRIIGDMFGEAARACGLPMSMFAISILCSTRFTGSIFPSANFMGMMGMSKCNNVKDALRGCWIAVGITAVAVIIWAFVGVHILT